MKIDTQCVHGSRDRNNSTGAICTPIYQSVTFAHPSVGQSTGYDYSRMQNPTREVLENTIAKLEGGCDALAFSSGMAALSCLMELFARNDHIITTSDLYGGSIRYFNNIAKKNGIQIDGVDMGNVTCVTEKIRPNTKAVFIETPTNPMMQITDIAAIKKITEGKNILFIVDNTLLTPYFQQPLSLGADIVLHSATKYLGGHHDTLCGLLVAKHPGVAENLRLISKTIGASLSPFDSFLIIRGIKTLAIRMEKAQKNAEIIAKWLQTQKKVVAVYHVGLHTHPGYAICKKQAKGFGAVLSFKVDTPQTAKRILERVQLVFYAESLGGVETLITYPIMQTHADVPPEEREARGIDDRLLRLSLGIENSDDIIDDLDNAMNG